MKLKNNLTALSLIIMLFAAMNAYAQDDKYADTYIAQTGIVHFFSEAPIENIDATSKTATCAINTKTKKVSVKIKQTSFVFKDGMMQDHFNENYMETDKYPYSILNMVIVENIDFGKDGVYDVTLKGTLEMHGVKNEREIKGKLTVKNGQVVNAIAEFIVKLNDYKIKIPSVVGSNISENVKVNVDFTFERFHK